MSKQTIDNGLGTHSCFQQQVNEFGTLCGTTAFWDLDFKHHEVAIKSLSYAYAHTDSGEYAECDASRFAGALLIYWRRAALMEQLRSQTEGGGDG